MPWNREKILAELDRDRIPRGVEKAIYDRPDLGSENLCYALERDGSSRLHSNCLWLLPHLLLRKSIKQSHIDQTLVNVRAHMSSDDESVRHAACRAAVTFAFLASVYPHLNLALIERCTLLDEAISSCPGVAEEFASQIRAARRPRDREK